jgi:hypothetical protein
MLAKAVKTFERIAVSLLGPGRPALAENLSKYYAAVAALPSNASRAVCHNIGSHADGQVADLW